MNFLHFYMIAGAFFFFAGVYVIKPFRKGTIADLSDDFIDWILLRIAAFLMIVICFLCLPTKTAAATKKVNMMIAPVTIKMIPSIFSYLLIPFPPD